MSRKTERADEPGFCADLEEDAGSHSDEGREQGDDEEFKKMAEAQMYAGSFLPPIAMTTKMIGTTL